MFRVEEPARQRLPGHDMSKERRWGGMLECTRCRLGILLLVMAVVTMAMMTATMMLVDVGSTALLMAVLGSGRSRAADTDDWQGSPVMEGGDGVRMADEAAVAQRTNGQFTRSRQTLGS
jgi:hypothetical protein